MKITSFLILLVWACSCCTALPKSRILQSAERTGKPFDAQLDTLIEFRLKKNRVKKERFSLGGKTLFYRNYSYWMAKQSGYWVAFQGKKSNVIYGRGCTSYYNSGKPRLLSSGYPVAAATLYYENGQIALTYQYDFEQQKLLNVFKEYAQNGSPLPLGSLKDGNGTVNYYEPNGQIWGISLYKNGKKIKTEKVKTKK